MKKMDHAAYIAKTKKMSSQQLLYVINDCKEAIEAMPDNPNCGYYMDEVHYCAMELQRRKS